MKSYYALLLLVVMVAASGAVCRASGPPPAAAAAKCDLLALRPCAPVVIWDAVPSAACCAKLREQRRCLCRYTRNPNLSKYISSQDAKKAAAACRVPGCQPLGADC